MVPGQSAMTDWGFFAWDEAARRGKVTLKKGKKKMHYKGELSRGYWEHLGGTFIVDIVNKPDFIGVGKVNEKGTKRDGHLGKKSQIRRKKRDIFTGEG